MARLWREARGQGAEGVLWQDPDIVIDPLDMTAMEKSITRNPDIMWHGAHKLWPASTGRDEWVWSIGEWDQDRPVMRQAIAHPAGWCSMGFTWTPAALLDQALSHLPFWEFGQIDMGLSRLARARDMQISFARGVSPKHLHFEPREGDPSWPSR